MLKIYDTLLGKKEILKPLDYARGKKLRLFVCGPTVYDFAHLGHARTYIAFDAFAKFLKQENCGVDYLQNITDIDDKIIQRAKELGEIPKELARRFEKEYFKDMKALGVTSVKKYARATDYIKEIIGQVQKLLKKGYAYQMSDGIYYDISKFKDYGKLSRRTVQQAEDAVSRIDESLEKRNKGDFALWKLSKPGEPKWKSPWGFGRPGWHIEDTAITEKHFGAQYDIHGGARDLVFPHHEAEIAQMEALSGKKPMARYWMHTGFLTINGQKMSKSLGNFIPIRDFLKEHSARLLRFFVLKHYYKSPIDYTESALLQAQQELQRIDEFVERIYDDKVLETAIDDTKNESPYKGEFPMPDSFISAFDAAMRDDFITLEALSQLLGLIRWENTVLDKKKITKNQIKQIRKFLKRIDKFLSFIFWGKEKKGNIPTNILKLAQERETYRTQKNWQKADELRTAIEQKGWILEDTSAGPKLKKSGGLV